MNEMFLNAAKTVVEQCLRVQETETVLVITDRPEREIGYAIFEAAKECAGETMIMEIIPRSIHGEEPPESVAEIMRTVDVIIAPTFRSISHTQARLKANESGTRIATMPGILHETFVRAMNVKYSEVANISCELAERLSAAKTARVVTEHGTDIFMSLEGRKGHADTGLIHRKGDFGNLPAGEAYIAPSEGTAGGTIVIDGAIGDTGILESDDYIKIRVENGYATEIDGDRASTYLSGIFALHPKDARNIAELGIGTNPAARLCGSILEDEKVLGTIHIAMGNNALMGGTVDVPIHLDGILLSPTLYLDGKLIMKMGKFSI